MRRLQPKLRRGSAPLHQCLLVSRRFARLRREAARDNVVAVGTQAVLPTFRTHRAFWRASGKKHPRAPPPDNRSTRQTHGAFHALRTLPRAVATRVRLSLPPNAHRKFFPQARFLRHAPRWPNATVPPPSIHPTTQISRRRRVYVRASISW